MRSQAWFTVVQVCLLFTVFVHSSVAVRLRKWISECNCSCLLRNATKLVITNCIIKETFTIDKQLNLQSNSNFRPKFERIRPRQLRCSAGRKKNRFDHFLINISCNGERKYVIYRRRSLPAVNADLQHTLNADNLVNSYRSTTLRPNQKEQAQRKSKTSNRLVIGLSVGFGLMVAIVICWTWIRCRRRRSKKKADKKEQNPDFAYIDEEEDSAPYRIVDLQTNISSDASGYTFLEARKPEEENPYMKLQPICKRIQNKESTEDVTQCFEEIVDEENEERPYETLLPTNNTDENTGCLEETKDFEEIADDPVYFMLEAKEKSSIS